MLWTMRAEARGSIFRHWLVINKMGSSSDSESSVDMNRRKLSAVYRWLEQRSYDTEELINNIDDVIIKTIISAHPILKHNYRTCFPHHDLCSACFEILGFDILLDYKLKPYVLEVKYYHTLASNQILCTKRPEIRYEIYR